MLYSRDETISNRKLMENKFHDRLNCLIKQKCQIFAGPNFSNVKFCCKTTTINQLVDQQKINQQLY